MANWTQTLTDSIRFLSPATVWGSSMFWQTDRWGYDVGPANFQLNTRSISVHNDSLPFVDNYGFGTVSSGDTFGSFAPSSTTGAEYLMDSTGKWDFAFAGGNSNDEYAFNPTYTIVTQGDSGWSQSTTSTISWTTST